VIEGNYAEDEEESQSEESYHTPLRDLGHIVFRRLKVLHDEDDAVSDANLRVFFVGIYFRTLLAGRESHHITTCHLSYSKHCRGQKVIREESCSSYDTCSSHVEKHR
jgi:hypothetical protein